MIGRVDDEVVGSVLVEEDPEVRVRGIVAFHGLVLREPIES
jgi:hypothetical protein